MLLRLHRRERPVVVGQVDDHLGAGGDEAPDVVGKDVLKADRRGKAEPGKGEDCALDSGLPERHVVGREQVVDPGERGPIRKMLGERHEPHLVIGLAPASPVVKENGRVEVAAHLAAVGADREAVVVVAGHQPAAEAGLVVAEAAHEADIRRGWLAGLGLDVRRAPAADVGHKGGLGPDHEPRIRVHRLFGQAHQGVEGHLVIDAARVRVLLDQGDADDASARDRARQGERPGRDPHQRHHARGSHGRQRRPAAA